MDTSKLTDKDVIEGLAMVLERIDARLDIALDPYKAPELQEKALQEARRLSSYALERHEEWEELHAPIDNPE